MGIQVQPPAMNEALLAVHWWWALWACACAQSDAHRMRMRRQPPEDTSGTMRCAGVLCAQTGCVGGVGKSCNCCVREMVRPGL